MIFSSSFLVVLFDSEISQEENPLTLLLSTHRSWHVYRERHKYVYRGWALLFLLDPRDFPIISLFQGYFVGLEVWLEDLGAILITRCLPIR